MLHDKNRLKWNLIWEVFHGPYENARYSTGPTGLAVAADDSDNIVMSGTAGTVKYSSDGQVLWAASERGDALKLDRFGNVALARAVAREDGFYESEITKLNSDGTRLWQTRFYDETSSDNRLAGLVLDDDGNIYFAVTSGYRDTGYQSTIVKFVEHGRGKDK